MDRRVSTGQKMNFEDSLESSKQVDLQKKRVGGERWGAMLKKSPRLIGTVRK